MLFLSLVHARAVVRAWTDEYNTERPQSSLGCSTPTAFAAEIKKQRLGRVQAVASGAPVDQNNCWSLVPADESRGSRRGVSLNKLSVVIPARNEEATIVDAVVAIVGHESISEVIVVDNGSVDRTGALATAAGARVVSCPRQGLGRAMKAGVEAAIGDLILRTDADIREWNPAWIDLLRPTQPHSLTRGIYRSPYSRFPMSNYVVGPFFALYRPDWPPVPIPTTGTYTFDRRDYVWSELPENWAIDVAILICAMESEQISVQNVEIGILADAERPPSHYVPMATDLIEFLANRFIRGAPPRQPNLRR